MQQSAELLNAGVYHTITPEKSTTVKELLKELKLEEGMCFGVLVNGKKATLETKISEKDSVVILPKIAGGSLPDQFFSVTELFLNGRGLTLREPVTISFTVSGYVVITGKIGFLNYREIKWLKKLSRSGEECFLRVLYENNFYTAVCIARYKHIHLKAKIKFSSNIRRVVKIKNEFIDFNMFEIDVEFEGKKINFPNNEAQKCFECGENMLLYYIINGLLRNGFNLKEAEKVLKSKFVRFLCCNCLEKRVEKSEANKKCS